MRMRVTRQANGPHPRPLSRSRERGDWRRPLSRSRERGKGRRRFSRGRAGFSLVELVAAMTVGATVFGLAVGLLYTLLRVGSGAQEQLRLHTTIRHLADQFRRDAHAAERVAPLPAVQGKPRPGWRFHLGSGRVVDYEPQQHGLVRSETADGKTQHREQYRLPAGTGASVQPPEAKDGIVGLRLVSDAGPSDEPRLGELVVEAQLAKDWRFARGKSP